MLYMVKLGQDIAYFSHFRVGINFLKRGKQLKQIDATERTLQKWRVILYLKY